MDKWGFWDWVGFGALGASALIMAIGQALRDVDNVFQLPGWANYIPLLFFVVGVVILILGRAGFLNHKASSAEQVENSIDWSIWKRMPNYTVRELSRILVKDDPVSSNLSSRAQAVQRLIFHGLRDQTLGYIRVLSDRIDEDYEPPNFDTRIPREAAIKWAKNQNIVVTHIE